MINLYHDPRGEKIFEKSNSTFITTGALSLSLPHGEDKNLVALQKTIEEKDQKISELEQELASFKVSSFACCTINLDCFQAHKHVSR